MENSINNRNIQIVQLCEQAEKIGVVTLMQQLNVHEVFVPYRTRLENLSIDEMNLSVRASNGLKRAGAGTLGLLWELLLKENGIMSVRNLGQKSAREIKRAFFEECYAHLSPNEKEEYWQEVITTSNLDA